MPCTATSPGNPERLSEMRLCAEVALVDDLDFRDLDLYVWAAERLNLLLKESFKNG